MPVLLLYRLCCLSSYLFCRSLCSLHVLACSSADCAASGHGLSAPYDACRHICSTTAWAFFYSAARTYLSYSSLCCPWTCLIYSGLCCPWTFLFSIAPCAAFERACPSTNYAVSRRICPAEGCAACIDVFVLKQTVLPQKVSVLKQPLFLDVSMCLFTSSLFYPWRWRRLACSSLCST